MTREEALKELDQSDTARSLSASTRSQASLAPKPNPAHGQVAPATDSDAGSTTAGLRYQQQHHGDPQQIRQQ
jgi:hypothetical protein